MRTRIAGGTIVTASERFAADLYLDGPRILALGSGLDLGVDHEVDASGCYVLPGGVDPHVHLDFPTLTTVTADDSTSGTAAAALGGTTTIINFALQRRGEPLPAVLERSLALAAGQAVIDYGFHVVVTDLPESRLAELDEIVRAGATSVKMFMAYPGELMIDDGTLLTVMERIGALGGLPMVHAENGTAIDVLIRRALAAGRTSPQWHGKTRPTILEAEAVHRAIVLAELTGAPAYFVHISCDEAAREVADAKHRGLPVFAETCPHYLTLDSSVYRDDDFDVAKYVMTPPLREPRHQAALWGQIRQAGLDVISTDHCPFCLVGQKDAGIGDFSRIPNGVGGVQYRLPLLYDRGVRAGNITLERLVAITATNPAKLFGLYPAKGTLAVGSDADVVVLDPRATTTITAAASPSKVDYSIYEGWTCAGAVRDVYCRGTRVVADGQLRGSAGHGRFVERGPTTPV
ncbi:dihydropyrimidinase [Pseudofrankia inefficax]|uniref:Dihydropyrimidinase n=1 Tax=Pseudofrankia inefficax (strain DSM 45817 / CECT 9037 / DDB 130130 / EuI1c) TaxID=298654 RepID=E3JD30_PSEI1|nr:dihydropyrimidinase [Pseudofrankia inefficax]ADP81169.1 dihydropyrimidinase [Pseudofrankia inefficax]